VTVWKSIWRRISVALFGRPKTYRYRAYGPEWHGRWQATPEDALASVRDTAQFCSDTEGDGATVFPDAEVEQLRKGEYAFIEWYELGVEREEVGLLDAWYNDRPGSRAW